MNTQTMNIDLLSQFDFELKAVLLSDVRKFREEKGKFLSNNPGQNQDNDLLVA